MEEKLKVLSLFDGISAGRLALDQAGINVSKYYASEIDQSAIAISKANWEEIVQLGNIKELDESNLPKDIDLLIGGSPCQTFTRSSSLGFEGKSGLFWEYIRILEIVNPKYFLLENVMMKKEWMDIISKALGVQPVEIDSRYFSAQKRQRLYWTNIEIPSIPSDQGESIKTIYGAGGADYINKDGLLWFDESSDSWRVKNATKKGFLDVNDFDVVNLDFPNSKTRRGRVSVGKSNTLNTACNQGVFFGGSIRKFSVQDCERLQTFPDGYCSSVSENQAKKALGNSWTSKAVSHIFKGIDS